MVNHLIKNAVAKLKKLFVKDGKWTQEKKNMKYKHTRPSVCFKKHTNLIGTTLMSFHFAAAYFEAV